MTESRPVGPGVDDDDLDRALRESEPLALGAVTQLVRPPADLGTRTRDRATEALFRRSLLGTAADLLTVGWETVRFLVREDDAPDDLHREVTR